MTAVENVFEQLEEQGLIFLTTKTNEMTISISASDYLDIKRLANKMFEQQIIDANYDGQYLHAKSVTNSMLKDNAEHYYNETYGSKGSDDHIVDTNEMVEDTFKVWECCGMEECICKGYNETPMLSRLKEHLNSITTEQFNNEIAEIQKDLGTFSQTDENGKPLTYWGGLKDRTCNNSCSVVCGECQILHISDEEIENKAETFWPKANESSLIRCWILGAKWYREQLKQRQ